MSYDVRVRMPWGATGILRMSGRRPPPCVKCGAVSTRLCDWKIKSSATMADRYAPGRAPGQATRGKTCSAPICDHCTYSPASDKDLCPTHAAEWRRRLERRGREKT
jgi:hypothetical protein